MAVSIAMPRQKEAGFDKFLRRLGGVADLANSGIQGYAGVKRMSADAQQRDDDMKGVFSQKELIDKFDAAKEGDEGAMKIQMRDSNGNVVDTFQRRINTLKSKSPLEDELAQAKLDQIKADTWATRNKPSQAEAMAQIKKDERSTANLDKKMQSMNEVEDRRRNIEDNLKLVEDMIKEDGTFEMFGSHNADLDRRIDMIATDMAKLADPSSVARPSEVEMFKKGLVSSGFGTKNSTALDLIKNFRSEVTSRADNAYNVRGLSDLLSEKKRPTQEPKEFAGMSDEQLKKLYDAKKQEEKMRAR
jgi:hypothetical protein